MLRADLPQLLPEDPRAERLARRVATLAELLDRVWGYGHDGYEHTVNSHINRLRSKIENDPAHPEFIVTMWGVGYKMNGLLDQEQCA